MNMTKIFLLLLGYFMSGIQGDMQAALNLLAAIKAKNPRSTASALGYIKDLNKNINEKTEHGETALHLACKKGNLEIVEALLNRAGYCADLDNDGNSCLCIIAKKIVEASSYLSFDDNSYNDDDCIKILILLLKNNAAISFDVFNHENISPRTLAAQSKILADIFDKYLPKPQVKPELRHGKSSVKHKQGVIYHKNGVTERISHDGSIEFSR